MVPGFESEDDDEFSDDDLTKEKNNGSFLGVKSLGKVYNSGYSFLIILPILHILKNQTTPTCIICIFVSFNDLESRYYYYIWISFKYPLKKAILPF